MSARGPELAERAHRSTAALRDEVVTGRPDWLVNRRSKATRTALFLKAGLPFEAWRHVGAQVGALNDASAWWIGDWLAYGVEAYPDRYRSAINSTGFGYQTLRNYAWVAGRFPPHRRRGNLSFGHHAELASLHEDDQETWLMRCTLHHWSRNELRRQLRSARACPTDCARAASVALALHVEAPRHARWRAAALAHGRPLADWVAGALDEAAEAALGTRDEATLLELAD